MRIGLKARGRQGQAGGAQGAGSECWQEVVRDRQGQAKGRQGAGRQGIESGVLEGDGTLLIFAMIGGKRWPKQGGGCMGTQQCGGWVGVLCFTCKLALSALVDGIK